MKRYRRYQPEGIDERVENPAIDAFLEEIKEVCKKHNLSIAHEDSQGAFVIEEYDEHNLEWLLAADDYTSLPEGEK